MKKIDYLWMAGLTLLSCFLIFARLGSSQAPQTELRLGAEEETGDELILDLGEETAVSKLYIFLGHMDTRTLSVSYYDVKQESWIVLNDASEAESVYNWNEVEVGQRVRYLGIVSRNNQAVYNEMVILDGDGNRILPVNADAYPALFDEQTLFPEEITCYYRTMFDEVYYARSAYELLHNIHMFEYTHPPLGKILMAAGLWLFGVTPFGWRFVCALLGALMTPLIYLLAHRITDRTRYAVIAAALLNLDFMHLALSRIATIDSIVAFFILAMFMAMYYYLTEIHERLSGEDGTLPSLACKGSGREAACLFLGAAATGAAAATKWTGFYAAAGIAVIFLAFWGFQMYKRKGQRESVWYLWRVFLRTGVVYLLFTVGIYLAAYIPMAVTEGTNVFMSAWQLPWEIPSSGGAGFRRCFICCTGLSGERTAGLRFWWRR